MAETKLYQQHVEPSLLEGVRTAHVTRESIVLYAVGYALRKCKHKTGPRSALLQGDFSSTQVCRCCCDSSIGVGVRSCPQLYRFIAVLGVKDRGSRSSRGCRVKANEDCSNSDEINSRIYPAPCSQRPDISAMCCIRCDISRVYRRCGLCAVARNSAQRRVEV